MTRWLNAATSRARLYAAAEWLLGRRSACMLSLAAVVLLSASCGPRGANGTQHRLVITGSSTVAPLMGEIAKRFESQHAGWRVDVQTGGSSRGIADVRRNIANIGLVSRSPKADESDLIWWPLARDGIGLIVHRDNPIHSINPEQVRAVFRGETRSWDALDPTIEGMEVVVVNKAEGRSTLELFLSHFELTSDEIDADVVIGDNEQGIKTVAANAGAIGYVSIGAAEYDISIGADIRLLPLNGTPATVEAVSKGQYQLSRTLHAVTAPTVSPDVKVFLDFALSSAVHDLIEQQYFVPLPAPTQRQETVGQEP